MAGNVYFDFFDKELSPLFNYSLYMYIIIVYERKWQNQEPSKCALTQKLTDGMWNMRFLIIIIFLFILRPLNSEQQSLKVVMSPTLNNDVKIESELLKRYVCLSACFIGIYQALLFIVWGDNLGKKSCSLLLGIEQTGKLSIYE